MIESFGYVRILLHALEIFSLIGLLLLFFLERHSYGRDSIGQESWTSVLLYNILTCGAYGVYWRLKVSYALHARDRLASWQWVFVLITVIIFYKTTPKVLMSLTIWDYFIGNRLTRATGKEVSWFWTFVCGHYYLSDLVEREAVYLPLDFRTQRPGRRQRIVKAYCVALVLVLTGTGLSYWRLVEHRKKVFDSIPAEAVDRSGHWQENDEKYETIYFVDEAGLKDTYTLVKRPPTYNFGEWARYQVQTKIHDGYVYSYSWFNCIQKQKLVEMTSSLLVLRSAEDKTLIESRIDAEEFAAKRGGFITSDVVDRGWEWGTLLKSPWTCELAFISKTWDQSLYFIINKAFDLIPADETTLEHS